MLLKSTLSKKSLRKLIEKSMRKFGKTEEEFEKNEKVEGRCCNQDASRVESITFLRTNELTWVGARSTFVSKNFP